MATGPAEAKEAVRMARRAKVNGAMGEQGEVLKLSTTRSFEGVGAPGSGRNRNLRGRRTCVLFYSNQHATQRAWPRHNTNEEQKSSTRGKEASETATIAIVGR